MISRLANHYGEVTIGDAAYEIKSEPLDVSGGNSFGYAFVPTVQIYSYRAGVGRRYITGVNHPDCDMTGEYWKYWTTIDMKEWALTRIPEILADIEREEARRQAQIEAWSREDERENRY